MDNKKNLRAPGQNSRKKEILTTEQCPRCRHPLRINPATKEKVCGNCGFKQK